MFKWQQVQEGSMLKQGQHVSHLVPPLPHYSLELQTPLRREVLSLKIFQAKVDEAASLASTGGVGAAYASTANATVDEAASIEEDKQKAEAEAAAAEAKARDQVRCNHSGNE